MTWILSAAAAVGLGEEALAEELLPAPRWREGRTLRLDAFEGRWSPRRALPAECLPAAMAAATALERAGWWRGASLRPRTLSLVVGVERVSHAASVRFARALASGTSAVGGRDFLLSLPSTLAGALGLLLGLEEEQTTLVGEAGGLDALDHAADRVELGIAERALVVVSSRVEVTGERAALLRPALGDDVGLLPGGPVLQALAFALGAGPPAGRSVRLARSQAGNDAPRGEDATPLRTATLGLLDLWGEMEGERRGGGVDEPPARAPLLLGRAPHGAALLGVWEGR